MSIVTRLVMLIEQETAAVEAAKLDAIQRKKAEDVRVRMLTASPTDCIWAGWIGPDIRKLANIGSAQAAKPVAPETLKEILELLQPEPTASLFETAVKINERSEWLI